MEIQKQLEEMSLQERREFLENHADHKLETDYFQRFSPDEVQQLQSDIADSAIKVDNYKEEKKALTSEVNEKIKAANAVLSKQLTDMRQGGETLNGTVYEFRDQDARLVHQYDSQGKFIRSRGMRLEERQLTVLNTHQKVS